MPTNPRVDLGLPLVMDLPRATKNVAPASYFHPLPPPLASCCGGPGWLQPFTQHSQGLLTQIRLDTFPLHRASSQCVLVYSHANISYSDCCVMQEQETWASAFCCQRDGMEETHHCSPTSGKGRDNHDTHKFKRPLGTYQDCQCKCFPGASTCDIECWRN